MHVTIFFAKKVNAILLLLQSRNYMKKKEKYDKNYKNRVKSKKSKSSIVI